MSTQYRVLVHCDARRGHGCHGFIQFSTKDLRRMASHPDIEQRGWLRGYGFDFTYDVCPHCRPAVEEERARAGKPTAPKEEP